MGKSAIDAKRGNVFYIEPERLVLVYDKEHLLYDPRVEMPADENMVRNIMVKGVIEPVIVRKNGQDIEVVAGRARTKAALEANVRLSAEGKLPVLVPVMIRGGDDADLYGVLVSENEIRREDSPVSKGEKARKMLNMGRTVQQIAIDFGVTRQTVENWLAVDGLSEEVKGAIDADEISATAAMQMADLPKEEQVELLHEIQVQEIKPTVGNVKVAAENAVAAAETGNASDDGLGDFKPKKKMRTRKQIKRHMEGFINLPHNKAYLNALEWVLGETDDEFGYLEGLCEEDAS